ncbi:MAG: recombination regulator RecX [Endomicrobium sp.]|jgi:regulatory protein|nr:recombination regulator RecX [Endomicrobium sp.]MDR2399351.1 recombination regulator RecX [Endomicrobium sp.]
MKILKIEKVKFKKNTFEIFFDNDKSIIVLADSIVKFGLSEGYDLQDKEYKEVVSYDKSNRIMSDALLLVSLRSYSFKGLQDKLLQKGYDKDNVLSVVSRLEALNYINDEKFSKSYAVYLSQKCKGEFAIKATLEKHGIRKSLISEALNSIKSQEEPYKQIVKIIASKFKNFDKKNKNEIRRIASFFLRRGFSLESIAKAFREYKGIYID